MSSPRLKIRCPSCGKDGSARAELANRRVACKHCAHTFRAVSVDDGADTPSVATKVFETTLAPPETSGSDESRDLRDELEQACEALRAARDSVQAIRLEGDQLAVDHQQALAELQGQLASLQAGQEDLHAARADRDRLAVELEAQRSKVADLERFAADRMRAEADEAAEAILLREAARQAGLDAEATRLERDQAVEALESFRASLSEAGPSSLDWSGPDANANANDNAPTEAEIPALAGAALAGTPDHSTVFDGDPTSLAALAEVESLRAGLGEATARLARQDEEVASLTLEHARALDRAETGRVEAASLAESIRAELSSARLDLEAASGRNRELADRVRALEAEAEASASASASANLLGVTGVSGGDVSSPRSNPSPQGGRGPEEEALFTALPPCGRGPGWGDVPKPPEILVTPNLSPIGDPAAIEAERRRAVDEAVKGAWADFERRLTETWGRLKAAESRADLMEAEAREARDQLALRERTLDLGDGSSFGELGSMTALRIMDVRGTALLTPADAEARLALARQMAVDRRDKALIDRITRVAEKVRDDLGARRHTLAETLVRGTEIEAGLDPGGYSIAGLRIFRPGPTVVGNLEAFAPALARVMAQGDPGAIQATLEEMRNILGDQAGLPEIRRAGRSPTTRPPITEGDALALFVAAVEAESWLIRPLAAKKTPPDTTLTTYAGLAESCSTARGPAESIGLGWLALLDDVIRASCQMILQRQQADGHFAFLDPRGKASKAASAVQAMVARQPGSVRDGWVVVADPIGIAQSETAACAVALLSAGKALGRPEWTQAALKAADWAMAQPGLPDFAVNAASAGLLARAYLAAGNERHLAGLASKLTLGVLPGQVEQGRWLDPASATTTHHLTILRGLHDAWEAVPPDRQPTRQALKSAIGRGMASLLEECRALGVPAKGEALRELVRHRDLPGLDPDPRLPDALRDSAAVVEELCHDGPKPKLGVAPEQLAALILVGRPA